MNLLRYLLACLLLVVAPAHAVPGDADPPGEQYAVWNSRELAVAALWGERQLHGRDWAWGTTYRDLDPAIRGAIAIGARQQSASGAGIRDTVYLVPQVPIRSSQLPRALHHLAAALLGPGQGTVGFDLGYVDGSHNDFILNTAGEPVPGPNGSYLKTYRAFVETGSRSRHDNGLGYLPALAPPACPAGAAKASATAWSQGDKARPARARAMDALDAYRPALTNVEKWHCLAVLAVPPQKANSGKAVGAVGYIELDHPDGVVKREFSDSNDGRVVYDYVNGRVFYTPTHYRPTYKDGTGAIRVSEDNACPTGQTCASPFFEIVR